jgi:hypothetical protein
MNPNTPENEFIVQWLPCIENLPSLKNHTCVAYKNSLILFGGYDGEKHLNSLYLLDLQTNKISSIISTGNIPKERNGHTATIIGN